MTYHNNRNQRPQGNHHQAQENIMDDINKAKEKLPYKFLPLDTSKTVTAEQIPHDGSQQGLYSGELRCEMTTLTPLLVGWKKHKEDEEDKDKKNDGILQPLLHPDDGRVLIPGTSIKGMIRQRIAMLTNAPMEKVAERTYSYRPNIAHATQLEARPAVITNLNTDGSLAIKLLGNARDAVFDRLWFRDPLKSKIKQQIGKCITGQQQQYHGYGINDRGKFIKQDDRNSIQFPLNHYVCSYKGGIDGDGSLMRAFSQDTRKNVHDFALVAKNKFESAISWTIDPEVVKHYKLTQKHLADEKIGHISNRHPLVDNANAGRIGRAIKEATELEPNQLIYVEYDTVNKKVVSFGHHFHYRWRFADTVTTQLINGENILRPELTPVKNGLSAPLAMFGYTQDKDALAGRISINFATEVISEAEKNNTDRFIDTGRSFALKPLGQPRPSAVEFYLKQQPNATKLITYGDVLPPNLAGKSDGGVLAGRKFYPHQTNTNAQHYKEQGTPETHNPRVRYVLPKDRKFRFTIRYKDLTDWEVGTLLLAIQPHLAKDGAKPEEYGLKLGYARPLGFGSVCIDAKQHHQFDAKDFSPISVENNDAFVKAIKGKVSNLDAWLGSAKLSAQLRNYPEKNGDIFAWHGDIRKKHAKQRRS